LIQGELKSAGSISFIKPGIPQVISRLGIQEKLTYDGDLLIEELSKRLSGREDESTSRTVFRYDSLERRIEQETYASHGGLSGRTVFEYGPEEDFKAVRFETGGSKTICEYNRYGQIVQSTHLTPDGTALFNLFWRYDRSYRMLECGSSSSDQRTIMYYNEAGKLIELQDRWGSLDTGQGWLKSLARIPFPKSIGHIDTTNPSADLDRNLKTRATYTYDPKGNVNKITWYQTGTEERWGKEVVSGQSITDLEEYTYEYDVMGKRTTSKLDENAKRSKPSEVAVRSITYFAQCAGDL
jgi:hypothetical protein